MRRLLKGVMGIACLVGLGGCAAILDPDKPFELLQSQDGWVKIDAAPAESDAIIASGGDGLGKVLNDKRYKVTWFQRGVDDYLIYFQLHSYVSSEPGCGDTDIEFHKTDGHWIRNKSMPIIVCAD